MNWLLYAILGAVLVGASYVFAKAGMHKSNSHLAAALRGTLLFVGAWFMVNQTGSKVSFAGMGQTNLLYLVFSGIAIGILWICLLRAIQLGEVTKVVPILEGSIVLELLVGVFIFHDNIDWIKIIILVLLTAGCIMMSMRGAKKGSRKGAWIGYACAAMALSVVITTFDRVGDTSMNSYSERLIRYGIALILVWLVVIATRGYKGLRSMSFLDGIYLCMSGAVMWGAWYCFFLSYSLGNNRIVDLVEQFDLVAAVVLGCVFLRERLSVRAIFGMIFMMLGFWMYHSSTFLQILHMI